MERRLNRASLDDKDANFHLDRKKKFSYSYRGSIVKFLEWQRSCLLTLGVKEKKLRQPEEKKELAQTLKTFLICRNEKERIRSMYNKTIH